MAPYQSAVVRVKVRKVGKKRRPWPHWQVVAGPQPSWWRVYPAEGAKWLMLHDIEKQLTSAADRNSTYVMKTTKFAILNERREETQGGFTGRHDGENRSPKTSGLYRFDVAPHIDNGEYPLLRYSPDPLQTLEAQQLETVVRAVMQTSRPTQRKRLRQGRAGVLLDNDTPFYWREPTGGVYVTAWEWKGGRYHKSEKQARRWLEQGQLIENLAIWPPTAQSEFMDMGKRWQEPATQEDLARAYRARVKTWGPHKTWVPTVPTVDQWKDERRRSAPIEGKTLRLNQDAKTFVRRGEKQQALLLWTDAQRAALESAGADEDLSFLT